MASQQEFDAIIKEVLGNRNRGASKSSPEYQAARDTAAKRMSGGRSSAFKPSTDKADMQSKSSGKKSSGGGKKKSSPSKRGVPTPSPRTQTPAEMQVPPGTGTRGEPVAGSDLMSWLPMLLAALGSGGAYALINKFVGRGAQPDPVAAGMSQQPRRPAGPVDPVAAGMSQPTARSAPTTGPAAANPAAAAPPRASSVQTGPGRVPNLSDAEIGDVVDPRVTEMIKRAQEGAAGLPEFMANPARGMNAPSKFGEAPQTEPYRFKIRPRVQ
jgi:hypothetical protein